MTESTENLAMGISTPDLSMNDIPSGISPKFRKPSTKSASDLDQDLRASSPYSYSSSAPSNRPSFSITRAENAVNLGGRQGARNPANNDSLDAIFEDYGQFSRYQKLLVFLVLLPCSIPCGLHQFDQVLMGFVPDHWCNVPDGIPLPVDNDNASLRCFEYEFANMSNPSEACVVPECPLVRCRNGWMYDASAPPSIISEFDLVCSSDMIPSIGLCIFQLANAAGMPIFGYLADRVGRKKSYILALLLQIWAALASSFSPNIAVFLFFRFLVGLTVPACFVILGMHGLELVGPDYRIMVSVLQCSFFTVGLCSCAGLAYWFPAWKEINASSSIVLLPLLALIWWAPESPRWSILNDKLSDTFDVFLQIIDESPTKVQDAHEIWRRLQAVQDAEKREVEIEAGFFQSIRQLGRSSRMRNKTILVTYLWATALTVYIGLGYYGPGIHENPYLGFFLSCAIEFLCYLPAYWYMSRVGRRPAYSLTLLIGGVSAVVAVAVPAGNSVLLMVVFLIAKLSIAAAFLITIPFAGETYPTELRAFGFSLGSLAGGILCVPAPIIVYLGTDNLVLPLIIFGSLAVVGSILSLFLPETLGEPMTQTVAQADEQRLGTPSSVFTVNFVKSMFTIKIRCDLAGFS